MDSAPLLSLLGGLTQGYSQGMGTAYQRNLAMMQMQQMMQYHQMMGTAAMGRMDAYTNGVDGRNGYLGNMAQLGRDKLATGQAVDQGRGYVPAGTFGGGDGSPQTPQAPQDPQAPQSQPSAAAAPPQPVAPLGLAPRPVAFQGATQGGLRTGMGMSGYPTPSFAPGRIGATLGAAPGGNAPAAPVPQTAAAEPQPGPDPLSGLGPLARLNMAKGGAQIALTGARTDNLTGKTALQPLEAQGMAYKNGVLMPSQFQKNQAQTAYTGDEDQNLRNKMPFTVADIQAGIGLKHAQTTSALNTAATIIPKANSTINEQTAHSAAETANAQTNGVRAQTGQGQLSLGEQHLRQQQHQFDVTAAQHGDINAIARLRAAAAVTTPVSGLNTNRPAAVPLDAQGNPTGPNAALYRRAMLQPMPPGTHGTHMIPLVGTRTNGAVAPPAPQLPQRLNKFRSLMP